MHVTAIKVDETNWRPWEDSCVIPNRLFDVAINLAAFQVGDAPVDTTNDHKAAAEFLILLKRLQRPAFKAGDLSFVLFAPPCAAWLVGVRE